LDGNTLTVTSAGTYDLRGSTIYSDITVNNTSGGAVIIKADASWVDMVIVGTGDITVEGALVVTQSVTVSGAVAGSILQIYDTTNNTQVYLGTPTFPYTWTDSEVYSADKSFRLRVAYCDGATAKVFIDTPIGTATNSAPAINYLVNQEDDVVYNENAVNGFLVTGITIVDASMRINIVSSGKTWQDIYAYGASWLATEDGIVDEGKYMVAKDQANYQIFDFKIKNTSSPSAPLVITGGYCVDGDTGHSIDILDVTGGVIVLAPDHVVPFSSGGSALTTQEHNRLFQTATADDVIMMG
jgi:hypothetical protein